MSGLYWLGLIVSVVLLVYLVAALFKPDIFD